MIAYLLGAAFATMVVCFVIALVAGAVAFFLNWRRINDAFRHPLLKAKPFKAYPFSLQAAIYLDYFFRIVLPKARWGMPGHANQLLAHVDAKRLPMGVTLPVAGFWGACMFGIVAMVSVWVLLLIGR